MKVLVACPTSSRHWYVVDEYLKHLKNQNIKFDLFMVDTSINKKDEYIDHLKSKGIDLVHYDWDPKLDPLQMLAEARNIYRERAIKENYDYLFHLDDDILLPKDGIKKLIDFDKDQVGYLVHIYHKPASIMPAVFKSGGMVMGKGLDFYSWSWVKKYYGQLKRVYASGLGCLLAKRKVFESVPFRTHPNFIYGEDLWYYAEADEKKFEAYCYLKRLTHKNVNWSEPSSYSGKKRMKLYVAFGPESAEGALFPPNPYKSWKVYYEQEMVKIQGGKDGTERKEHAIK